MEERGPIVTELRQIRQSLGESINVADHMLRKFRGPIPMDTRAEPTEASESLTTIVGDIKRQSRVLSELLAAQHEILGDVGGEKAPARSIAGGRG